MSSPGPFQQGQLPSPGLSITLSSNNPFRNRAASPASPDVAAASSTSSPFDDPTPGQRPISRNPFLDQSQQPSKLPSTAFTRLEHKSLSAEDIFDSLTLDDTMVNEKLLPALTAQRRPSDQSLAARSGKPQPDDRHRPTKSQEEASKLRRPAQGPGSALQSGASRSPQKKQVRRQRRNSDSSVMDFNAQPITAEEMKIIEEHRMRDRQRREKAAREKESREKEVREGRESRDKEREGKGRSKSGRPSRRMDIIDQLDATSIYGTGLFHHDGPFDALNPHRNRHTSRRAPMQAFPKDSLNNSLGGSGPLNRNPDHATFMGHSTDEAFRDYSGGMKNKNGYSYPTSTEPTIFDPISRGSIVHGDESYGLGTSTFLEGTPAARSAIARRQVEDQQKVADHGLQRKKSLAQRIRQINRAPRDLPSGRLTNPDAAFSKRSPDPTSLASSVGSEPNPFLAEFIKGDESISVKTRNGAKSPVSPPTVTRPRRSSGSALERRVTADASSPVEDSPPTKPGGLLGRMKSLKGGRRTKNMDTHTQSTGSGMAT
ncbi:Pal1 cell morphology protein [Metarhizium rileyi]|uniref:Pal1 cell morphology protein n=1 Tax=Metarhizium rileyi (strain RCEF 4871) TaxID=1649241 RepID=A0A167I1K3_METRR|nr:Pal1 cell morphology protein [Metarhizium rileyi RCEF 4871]TWU74386.1 hypothetical protein ED733_002154 [Metarhizium rileyi]